MENETDSFSCGILASCGMCNVGKKVVEGTSFVIGIWKLCQKKNFCSFFPYD